MKGRALFLGIGIIVLVGAAVFFVVGERPKPSAVASPTVLAVASAAGGITSQEREVPAGFREYKNPAYRFSILYAPSLSVQEFQESSGGMTVTFQNEGEVKGFQVYITPYTGGQITDEQFRRDNPSGVRKDLKDITIDGAVGASFYSMDSNLGETAEIWFVKGGWLYEVTTLKSLAPWLSDIMTTWKFI